MKMSLFTVTSLLFASILPKSVQASDPYPRQTAIDIRHYIFRLDLNDSTDQIAGEASVTVRFKRKTDSFTLDLAGVNASGKGMTVASVTTADQPVKFAHSNDRLTISVPPSVGEGEDRVFVIRYKGIPSDGLIIGKNKYGDRGFFGDNWPDRAHYWLPCVDHPYEKATLEFAVVAPDHYSVVATGKKVEESAMPRGQKMTRYRSGVILPAKVITIGVAHFAVSYEGLVANVPLESWVYPQNRSEGFKDYAMAAGPLQYFSEKIAPYPYEKLANVQSKTRFGGLENAGNIFYYENSVTGKGTIEALLAHEIAHQWFGDSASESDWFHVWLSEGFATYLTQLYLENTYGRTRLQEEMTKDRSEVIAYYSKSPTPVVDETIKDINRVLSTNTYQKASFVLHMLRKKVGDARFWEGLRTYYQRYQFGNALTDDFRKVMEEVSGQNLGSFFQQWIYRPGHPRLDISWRYDAAGKQAVITVTQLQPQLFEFPLEIQLGTSEKTETLPIALKKQEFKVPSATRPTGLMADPSVWLLFEANLKESK